MIDKTSIYDFLKSKNFRLIEQLRSESFGNYCDIFSNDILEIRFVSDRSIETIDIENVNDKENWYDLAIIRFSLYKEEDLTRSTTIEQKIDFLYKEFEYVQTIFDFSHYLDTKLKLDILRHKRREQMFPGW